jgi:hypothetical protein
VYWSEETREQEEVDTMKHLGRITVAKASAGDPRDMNGLLDRVFGFVLDLVDAKGKGHHPLPVE